MSEDSVVVSGGGPPTAATSINFDAQELYEADEREYHQEEQHMQNELRALLTDAFDDLSDEEDFEFGNASQISQDLTGLRHGQDHAPVAKECQTANEENWSDPHHHHQHLNSHHHSNQHHNNHHHLQQQQQQLLRHQQQQQIHPHQHHHQQHIWDEQADSRPPTSTPYQHAPPLLNPGTGVTYQHHDNYHHDNRDLLHYGVYRQSDDGVVTEYEDYNWNGDNLARGQEEVDFGERGEVEGGNEEGQYYDPSAQQDGYHYVADTQQHDYDKRTVAGDLMHTYTTVPVSRENQYSAEQQNSAAAITNTNMATSNQDLLNTWPLSERVGTNGTNGNTNDYKVKYSPKMSAAPGIRQAEGANAVGKTHPVPTDKYQRLDNEFFEQTGDGEARQVAQLRILYDARGERITELSHQMEEVRETSERELRILKHKLTMTQDERDGLHQTLDQNKHLLEESGRREGELTGRLAALEMQIETLNTAKTELVRKLQTAESAVESLNSQLQEIGCSESLVRAKEQHESVVSSLKHKHEEQLLSLNSQLDKLLADKHTQDGEIKGLKQQVSNLTKAAEDAKIDRADTINRLSRSLDESQRQCRELLEAGAGMEASKLKISLQDAIAGKSIAEDMNAALQDEIKELKEQVVMYESASQYGILPPDSTLPTRSINPSPALDDSYAQLGIKKHQTRSKTPDMDSMADSSLSPEGTVQGLKSELERCLGLYRAKRQLVDKLNKELKASRTSLTETKQRLTQLEEEAGGNKKRVAELESQVGERLETITQAELSKVKKERDDLFHQLKEVKLRLEESASNEEKVTELNCELSRQMSQLIHDFDEDKRQALDKCRETCLAHHEETKARFQRELEEEYQDKRAAISSELEEQIEQLRSELSACQQDLDEIKEMYVSACQEKDQLESTLTEQHQIHLAQVKEHIAEEKEEALKQLTERLTAEHNAKQADERHKLRLQEEEALQSQVQKELIDDCVQLLKAHEQWQSEKEYAVDLAVKRALETAAVQTAEKTQTSLQHAKEQWVAEKQTETESQLENALIEWRKTELPQKVQEAKERWIEDDLPSIKEEWMNTEQTRLQSELCRKFEDAGRQEMEAVLSELREELSVLKQEKKDLEDKVVNVVMQKDAERKQAILNVQDTCEKDYKQFIQEHQDTLNKALKSARTQFAQEKEELVSKHQMEMVGLQKTSVSGIDDAVAEERSKWSSKLDALTQLHEAEKAELSQTQSEEQMMALKQAKLKWQEEMEECMKRAETRSHDGDIWKTRCVELETALQEQEELFATADAHMEAELSRLQSEVMAQHSQQLDRQMSDIEKQYAEKLDEATSHVDKLVVQLENMHADMQALQKRYNRDVEKLSSKLDVAEESLVSLRTSAESNKKAADTWNAEKEMLDEKVLCLEQTKYEIEVKLKKAEQLRQEAIRSYRRADEEHAQMMASYKQRQVELTERLHQADKNMKQLSSDHQSEMANMQESLEREHALALDKMKNHVLQAQKDNSKKAEELRRKFAKEKEGLMSKIAELQEERRELATTPVQTEETDLIGGSAVDKLHRQYMEAVSKIREDVMKHVKQSNEKAALTVREEMVRERQATARRLKRYYLKFLDKVLTDEPNSASRAEKMAAMRKMLDNLPEKDSNSSGTSRPHLSDLITPRSDATSHYASPHDNLSTHKTDLFGLPEDTAHEQVNKWVNTRARSNQTYTVHQSTPKSTRSLPVLDHTTDGTGSVHSSRRSQCVVTPLQLSPDESVQSSASVTPRIDNGEETSSNLYFASQISKTDVSNCTRAHQSLNSDEITSKPSSLHHDEHLRMASSSPLKTRRHWEGSSESLSAIDFTSKEIVPRSNKANKFVNSNARKEPTQTTTFVPFKYKSLKDKLTLGKPSTGGGSSGDDSSKQDTRSETGSTSTGRKTYMSSTHSAGSTEKMLPAYQLSLKHDMRARPLQRPRDDITPTDRFTRRPHDLIQ